MSETVAELHERLRLIALEMHGLAGIADACEDSGDTAEAEALREILATVRALIPDTADSAAITFEWAVRFTAKAGRRNTMPARDEAEARDMLADLREHVGAEKAHRYALRLRAIGGWVVVDA